MNVSCPGCNAIYRLDPERVPKGGARSRCRSCGEAFVVRPDAGAREAGVVVAAGTAAAPAAASASTGATGTAPSRPAAPAFGPQDPDTRARRLARALVSDIKVYNRDKWESSRQAGTLRQEFRTEILKSWEEYIEQVGEEKAKSTPFFREALNDILAEGKAVF